jgi:hypothetical protein
MQSEPQRNSADLLPKCPKRPGLCDAAPIGPEKIAPKAALMLLQRFFSKASIS